MPFNWLALAYRCLAGLFHKTKLQTAISTIGVVLVIYPMLVMTLVCVSKHFNAMAGVTRYNHQTW